MDLIICTTQVLQIRGPADIQFGNRIVIHSEIFQFRIVIKIETGNPCTVAIEFNQFRIIRDIDGIQFITAASISFSL